MGLSTLDLAKTQMTSTILEPSSSPIQIQENETSGEGKAKPIRDFAKQLFVDISTDQPFSLEGVVADVGARTYDLLSPSKNEGDSATCKETAQKTVQQLAIVGLVNLSSIPVQKAIPVFNTLPIQTVADVYQVAFLTLSAEKDKRLIVAVKETSGVVLTCAAVALATCCAQVVIPAVVIKTVAMTILINFTAGMAARGAIKAAENLVAPAA